MSETWLFEALQVLGQEPGPGRAGVHLRALIVTHASVGCKVTVHVGVHTRSVEHRWSSSTTRTSDRRARPSRPRVSQHPAGPPPRGARRVRQPLPAALGGAWRSAREAPEVEDHRSRHLGDEALDLYEVVQLAARRTSRSLQGIRRVLAHKTPARRPPDGPRSGEIRLPAPSCADNARAQYPAAGPNSGSEPPKRELAVCLRDSGRCHF